MQLNQYAKAKVLINNIFYSRRWIRYSFTDVPWQRKCSELYNYSIICGDDDYNYLKLISPVPSDV